MPEWIYRRCWYQAFYSRELYRGAAREGRGSGLAYLALIVLFTWLPQLAAIHLEVAGFLAGRGEAVAEQFPALTLSNGRVSAEALDEEAMPVKIYDPADGRLLALIDTSGKTGTLAGTEAYLLITGRRMFLRLDEGEEQVVDLSRMEDTRVDSTMLKEWIRVIRRWFFAFLLIPGLLFHFALRLLQAALVAVLSILPARLFETGLDFEALMRLAAAALTPAILLDMLRSMLDLHPPFWFWIMLAIALGYMLLALRYLGSENSEPSGRESMR